MMNIRTLFILASLGILFACAKEAATTPVPAVPATIGQESPASPERNDDGVTCISVRLADAATRISLTQDEDLDGPVKLAWEETDKLYINGEEFTIVTPLNENRQLASFTGPSSIEAPYTIVYGAESETAADAMILAEQHQDGNSSTAHLPYVAMLSGVNTLEDISFTRNWAAASGGSFKQTGILRIRLKLPDTVTSVNALTVTASSDIFYTSNACSATTGRLKLTFDNQATPTDGVINAYMMLPWQDVALTEGTDLTLTVTTPSHDIYHRTEDAGGKTLKTGMVNAIKLTCDNPGTNVSLDDFAGGSGVEGDPYLIGNERQMRRMDANMTAGSVTWFELIDDITMSDTDWTALNNTATGGVFSKYIHFDGKNKTIGNLHSSGTYASLFGVLNGTVQNLTLDGAVITPGSTKAGVLAAFIGSGGTQDVSVSGITISNSNVGRSAAAGTSYCGILAAQVSRAGTTVSDITITGCHVYGSRVGGLIASVENNTTICRSTFSGGSVTGTYQYIGGLFGYLSGTSVVSGCQVENTTIDATSATNDPRAGGFAGFINNSVRVQGCSVGTAEQKVTVQLGTPAASGNKLNSGGFVGVHYGTITKNGETRTTAYTTVTCTNTNTTWQLNIGGFVGYERGTIEYTDASVTMTDLKGIYIGGFAGYATSQANTTPCQVSNCTLTGSITGNNYTGGFVGYVDANTPVFSDDRSSGSVTAGSSTGGFAGYVNTGSFSGNTSSMTVSGASNVGGFAGAVVSGTLTSCSSTGDNISGTGGTYGGLLGYIYAGTVSQCHATGNVTPGSGESGGLIGAIKGSGDVNIQNSYATGSISVTNQRNMGGLIGVISNTSGNVSVSNCYACGNVAQSGMEHGGLIGRINAANTTVEKCAAWNGTMVGLTASNSWPGGAVVGVAFPTCTLTDNYRRPDMSLTAWWVPAADYQHANVSSSHPLVIKQISDGTLRETTATSLASGQDNYPQFAYHGKVEAGKTLSQLASTTLGWSSEVWDFTGDLPTLKNNPQ